MPNVTPGLECQRVFVVSNGSRPIRRRCSRDVGGICDAESAGRFIFGSVNCLTSLGYFLNYLPRVVFSRADPANIGGGLQPIFAPSMVGGCDEGSESRLAAVDSGRKNCCGIYRIGDVQHGSRPAPSRRGIVSGRRSTCNRSRRVVWRMLT